jgi:hypothetical protein
MNTPNANVPKTEFDYTMMSTFLRCRRKYDYRINKGLVPRTAQTAPSFGKSIHLALDHWYIDHDVEKAVEIFKADYKEDLEVDDKRTHKMGEWILKNYHEKYQDQPYEVLSTEQQFTLDLPNGNKLIGRIDKVIKWSGTVWVVDHKTTSSLGASYVKMAEPNLQFDGYTWAVRKMGFPAVGVIVDAILVAKGLLESSTRARLTPLLRYDSYRTDEQLKEYEGIACEIQEDIKRCEESGKWCPNYDSCTYYGECPFRRACLEEVGLRERILESEYKVEHWSPIQEEKSE